jgi:hypothetical protein
MTTLQTPPQQPRTTNQDTRGAQAGDLEQTRQAEQQARDARNTADKSQSGDSGSTFTVSTDDWF